jgi:glycosyltransferase involved in cell wall biosynthesis
VFQQHPEVMWYIAGDGPEREAIEQEIQSHGLQDQVILLGNLSNPYPYMRNADLLMNLSYHEAAPMVFLEANALSTPVFATETSSARELLEGYPCSIICENSEQGIYKAFSDWAERPPEKGIHSSEAVCCEHNNDRSLLKIQQWLGS